MFTSKPQSSLVCRPARFDFSANRCLGGDLGIMIPMVLWSPCPSERRCRQPRLRPWSQLLAAGDARTGTWRSGIDAAVRRHRDAVDKRRAQWLREFRANQELQRNFAASKRHHGEPVASNAATNASGSSSSSSSVALAFRPPLPAEDTAEYYFSALMVVVKGAFPDWQAARGCGATPWVAGVDVHSLLVRHAGWSQELLTNTSRQLQQEGLLERSASSIRMPYNNN
jgi:hypothetical protein